jgi:hypothetical protein
MSLDPAGTPTTELASKRPTQHNRKSVKPSRTKRNNSSIVGATASNKKA